MSNLRATSIAFVAGHWHAEFHVKPALAPLQAAGYEVTSCPLLTGTQETRASFADEAENICSKISTEIENGTAVCIVTQSAGGLPAIEGINKFLSRHPDPKNDIQLVFVSAFLNMERMLATSGTRGWFQVDTETMISSVNQAKSIFYNDMSVDESRPFVEALKPAMIWLDSPKLSSDDWKSIKRTSMLCLRDNAMFAEQQREEIAENNFAFVEIDSGHCPFISQPEKFVATLDQILTP